MDRQIELIKRHLEVTRVSCKFSRIKSIERQSYRGRAARVIERGKLGHASTTDGLTDVELVQRAREAACVSVPKALRFPSEIAAHSSAPLCSAHPSTPLRSAQDAFPNKVDQLSNSDLHDWARQLLRVMRQHNPRLSIELNVSRVIEQIELRNSNGGEAQLTRAWLEAEAWVERHADSEVLVVLDRFITARADDSHLDFARRMARRFRWARKLIEPVSGPQRVIFSPGAFASLLAPLLLALNGSFAFQPAGRGSKRRSGFASQLGQTVFDPQFGLVDDATLPDRPYSAPADHEGTRSQCTPLIVDGVITSFYHNLISAAHANTCSTGNGWRDLLEPPQAAPTNVRVSGGNLTLAEMLRNLDDGLLIDVIGEGDDAIGLTGDFARTLVLAYQVKRGRIVGYVRGASVSGDLYGALRRITALSSEGYWSDHVYAPYIQLDDVVVSA